MPGPPAAGVRIPWHKVPARVRAEVESRLGSPVVSATTQSGGFSPAAAVRIVTAAGSRSFVKAVPCDRNPDTPDMYRREAQVASILPPGLPVPRLLWWFDEGPAGWVVLAFEDIDGRHPAQPWKRDELRLTVQAIDQLAAALTPSPIAAPPAGELVAGWRGWSLLADEHLQVLGPWVRRNHHRLLELDELAPAAVAGETLLHLDIRADNLLLTDARVHVVDWPFASVGAAWVDPLFFAPSVEMQGGPPAGETFALSKSAGAIDRDAQSAALAALTGMLVEHGFRPPPPGLPTIRAFQAAQGGVALRWLKEVVGWE